MRRVLSLSTLYPSAARPQFGTFVARSLESLAARGDWDVTVINPVGIPPLAVGRYRGLARAAKDAEENGVKVFRPTFGLLPGLSGRRNPAAIFRKVMPLARMLHERAPFDVVDAQFFYPDGPAAARIARELHLPFSIKARGADIHYWGAKAYARRQMQDAASQAAGLLAVSRALANDMAAIGLPREKIALHYTGLDRDLFRPLDHPGLRSQLATSLDLPPLEQGVLLAAVGALIPRKGQRLVIEALPRLADTRLLLVGTGPDERNLRELSKQLGIADCVHFLGSLDHDLLPVLLSAADAMVLPSASEGLANAWVEALACGTPIVITDAGGAREVVTAPEAGRIVDRNPQAIAAAVLELVADPPDPEAVTAHAERFSWQANAAALAAHYDRLIAKE